MLGALEVAEGPDGRGEYWAFCPAHDDRNTPNLHVRKAEDGDILLRCFAGCTQDEVLTALERRGVRKRDLFYRSDAAGDSRLGSSGEAGERGVYLPPESRATL